MPLECQELKMVTARLRAQAWCRSSTGSTLTMSFLTSVLAWSQREELYSSGVWKSKQQSQRNCAAELARDLRKMLASCRFTLNCASQQPKGWQMEGTTFFWGTIWQINSFETCNPSMFLQHLPHLLEIFSGREFMPLLLNCTWLINECNCCHVESVYILPLTQG